jgi:hypothetical protein
LRALINPYSKYIPTDLHAFQVAPEVEAPSSPRVRRNSMSPSSAMFTVHAIIRGKHYDPKFRLGTKVGEVIDHIREISGLLLGGMIVDGDGNEVESDTINMEGEYKFDHDHVPTSLDAFQVPSRPTSPTV